MLGLREFIQKKLNEDNEDVTIANEDHIADMVGKEIIKAELDRSACTLELYSTMLAETEEKEGTLWGPNPGPDWICEMRIRVVSTFGPSSERAVQAAQQKVMETLRKSINELLADRQWDRVTPVITP